MRRGIWLTAAFVCAVSGLLACKGTDEVPGKGAAARTSQTAQTAQTARATPSPAAARPASDGHDHESEMTMRRITVAELQAALSKNEAVVADVRGTDAYNAGHIKDSVSVPDGDVDRHLDKLPKDKLIVFYCA